MFGPGRQNKPLQPWEKAHPPHWQSANISNPLADN
jgi:hypothetical protein